MRSQVAVLERDGRYVLRLQPVQLELITRVVLTYLDMPRSASVTRLLIGTEKERALALLDQAGTTGSRELVLSLDELHVLHSVLACACLAADSEEAFHIRTGFFVENVRGLALGLADAVSRIQ